MSESALRTDRKAPPTPIPMTVLTGFLSAGKTTLLNRLLKDTALAETAVIINEFGEAPLDHLLVEYVGDNMVVLQSGCLCCTMRGDLVDALETLLRDLDNLRCKFRRVLLETTADPAPVLHTAMARPYLLLRYRLDGAVTVSTRSTVRQRSMPTPKRSSRQRWLTASC
jgi:G3E family GTPase